MFRYVKDGERREGTVVGAAGVALRVDRVGESMCQEIVHRHEADDPAEFSNIWRSLSPLASVAWQTDEGPLEIPVF